jgi:hypothetical protein
MTPSLVLTNGHHGSNPPTGSAITILIVLILTPTLIFHGLHDRPHQRAKPFQFIGRVPQPCTLQCYWQRLQSNLTLITNHPCQHPTPSNLYSQIDHQQGGSPKLQEWDFGYHSK